MFRDPYGRAFLLPDISKKMRNITQTEARQEQTLPINLIGLMTTPSYHVEDPIHEIQQIYGISFEEAFEVFQMVGDRYISERIVASFCGIATPSYLESLKGGLQ